MLRLCGEIVQRHIGVDVIVARVDYIDTDESLRSHRGANEEAYHMRHHNRPASVTAENMAPTTKVKEGPHHCHNAPASTLASRAATGFPWGKNSVLK